MLAYTRVEYPGHGLLRREDLIALKFLLNYKKALPFHYYRTSIVDIKDA